MIIKHGTYRLVLIFDHFVIKIAKIQFFEALIMLVKWAWAGKLKTYLALTFGSFDGPKEWLLKGIIENWEEFTFCILRKELFVMPTYFSFFGLLNIQKRGSSSEVNYRDLDRLFLPILGKKIYSTHHWSNSDNFVLDEFGHIRMCDYGSTETKKEIIRYGSELCVATST